MMSLSGTFPGQEKYQTLKIVGITGFFLQTFTKYKTPEA